MLHDYAVMFSQIAHLSGFSLERLASLCEVAEAGSIGQASGGDANRQSLLSRQIAELEAVFGLALLSRQSRPYRLTSEGRELAQAARQFFQVADDLQRRAADAAQRVVIGAGETLIQWLLFPASEAIQRQAGKVIFTFKNLDSTRLLESLQSGEVDIGLIRREEVTPSLMHSEAWSYALAAFVPKVLSRSTATLKAEELSTLPWAALEGRGHFRQFLEDKASAAGIKLNAVLECSSYTQVAMAIQTGRYAGFLPEFAKHAAFGGNFAVVQRPVAKELRYDRSLVLAWREATVRNRPLLEKVIEALRGRLGRSL